MNFGSLVQLYHGVKEEKEDDKTKMDLLACSFTDETVPIMGGS
jgi:hypothetical protein